MHHDSLRFPEYLLDQCEVPGTFRSFVSSVSQHSPDTVDGDLWSALSTLSPCQGPFIEHFFVYWVHAGKYTEAFDGGLSVSLISATIVHRAFIGCLP